MNPRSDKAEDADAQFSASMRGGMVVLAVALVGVLATARWLEPDPRGFGTHTQLGLPSCHFARMTGHPCPSCGMTTAFAWAARGRLDRSWQANPAGALFATACTLLVPWLVAGAVRGKTLAFRSPETPLIGVVVATVAVSLVSWTVRLFFSSH